MLKKRHIPLNFKMKETIMTEKECKWLHDEFCTNDQCPMCADYCPTAQYPGVCKYEELVDVKYCLAPVGCLAAALTEGGVDITQVDVEKIFETFKELMVREGYMTVTEDDEESEEASENKPIEFKVGATVKAQDIFDSDEWGLFSMIKDCATYVSTDNTMAVCFCTNDPNETATIFLNR